MTLTRSAGSRLTRSAGLSADTISRLSAGTSDIESIVIQSDFYTKIWDDILNKKMIHDQSTFGPDFCKEENICKTPMCSAGAIVHIFNRYDLSKKYGFAKAAEMIHYKHYPDYPCQNFGSIPQEWALAWIETAAEMESNLKK